MKNKVPELLEGVYYGIFGLIAITLIILLFASLLDIFIALNLIFALTLFIIAFSAKKVPGFSFYPAFIILSTLFNLAVNISATLFILIKGTDFDGWLITFFSALMTGSENHGLFKGSVSFLVILAVDVVVIFKGSTRTVEAARFIFDSFPAKQMAIEAEYNSGAITEEETIVKKSELQAEVDFYSSMYGAYRFLSGNGKIRLIIIALGFIGVILIGTLLRGQSISDAINIFFPLIIGNGVLCLLPAFLVSTAMVCISSRVTTNDEDKQEQPESINYIVVMMIRLVSTIFIILPLPAPVLDVLIAVNIIFALALHIKVCCTKKTIKFSLYSNFFIYSSILGRVAGWSSIGLLFKGTAAKGYLIRFISRLAVGSGENSYLVAGFSIIILMILVIVNGILCIRGQRRITKLMIDIEAMREKKLTDQGITTSASLEKTYIEGPDIDLNYIRHFIFGNGKLKIIISAFIIIGMIVIGNLLKIESIKEAAAPYIAELTPYNDRIITFVSLAFGAGYFIMNHAMLLSAATLVTVKRITIGDDRKI